MGLKTKRDVEQGGGRGGNDVSSEDGWGDWSNSSYSDDDIYSDTTCQSKWKNPLKYLVSRQAGASCSDLMYKVTQMPEAQSSSPSLPQLSQELPMPTALIERLPRRYLANALMLAYTDFNQLFLLENDTS